MDVIRSSGKPSAIVEWRDGWPLVLAATLGIFTAVLYVYSTGLFIEPLGRAYGWSRATVTGGMLMVGIVAALGNPLIGRLLDRTGPAPIALAGCLSYSASLASLALAGPDPSGWWLGWAGVALSSLAISIPVWLVAIVRSFERSRGKALAVGYCGSSIAAVTIPFLSKMLMDDFGWRGAYIGLALVALLFGGTASAILLWHNGRLRPSSQEVRERTGAPVAAALRGPVFWRIAVMSLLVTLGVLGLTVHFVSICSDHGIKRTEAVRLAGLIGIAGIIGRLGTGVLLDRFHGPKIGAVIYLIPAAACLLLWVGEPGAAGMALVALAIGAALGAELDIMAYLAGRYFRLADYGFLFGILTGIVGCAAGFGPLFASWLRDVSGDYDKLALILMVCFLSSSILVGTLGPYPAQSER